VNELEEYRRQWAREDQALAFWDEVDGRITGKALAAKFNLKASRLCMLLRRHRERRERGRLLDKIERLEAGAHIAARAGTFTAVAERLWMELGWLATELENRRQE
jgi:hypothetical protein